MANIPYKYYAHDGIIEPWAGTNTPYAGSGFSEVGLQDFLNYAKSTKSAGGWSGTPETPTLFDYYQKTNPGAIAGVSDYIIDPQGNFTLKSSYDQSQANASNPNLMNVGTAQAPLYIPKGSAAQANLPNIGTQNTALNAANQPYYSDTMTSNFTKGSDVTKILGVPSPNSATGGTSTNYNGITAGALAAGGATGGILPEQTTYDQTQTALLGKLQELEGQTAYQQTAEQSAGVQQKKQDLADAQAALRALNAEAASEQARIEGRPMALGAITGQQGEVERMRAVKALSLSSQIQALQGNLTLAEEQAARAVSLKYDPIKAQVTTLSETLKLNYQNLTRVEKKQADALEAANELKLDAIKDQEAKDKTMESLFITALSNGAPIVKITAARALYQSGKQDEAISSLSAYTGPENYGPGTGTDIFQKALDALTVYKNAGYDRETVEEEIKNQNDGVISLVAQNALDKLYPVQPEAENEYPWYDPRGWF